MEEYALQWDSFKENIISGFGSIYNLGDYVDCSLACEDGKILQAHKMVLGICSPYFRSMLARNPCKHPTFILKDINHSTMSQILEFMYKGEVLVKQNDFSTFMRISKMFKIKGLMDADDEPPFIDVPVIPPPTKYTPSPKIAKLAQSSRLKPTPQVTNVRPPSVQSSKRRHESPIQSPPTHKQIKYEEESNDPLVQESESIYEDEVLEEDPEEALEHKYTTTTTYDIQPTDEIHIQQEHDDQEMEQQSLEQHDDTELVEEHEELEEDDDDEFDDQGLTLLRQTEAPRMKKEAPKPSPAPKPRAQSAATYTSSTLNLHTAVKNLGLPPMPFSSYKDFITFENKVREDEELMAALIEFLCKIRENDWQRFVRVSVKSLVRGSVLPYLTFNGSGDTYNISTSISIVTAVTRATMEKFDNITNSDVKAFIQKFIRNAKDSMRKSARKREIVVPRSVKFSVRPA